MSSQSVQLTEAEVSGANVFWVGEGARKSTDAPAMSSLTWTISAAELAVIVPLDENVQDDASVDIFDLYKPAIETAIGKKLDAAAIFGIDKPAAWGTLGTDIVPNAVTAANVFTEDADPTDDELLELLSGTGATTADGALQALEDDGYEPTGALAYIRFKSRLRNLKDLDGRYIFGDAVSAGVPGSLFGVPISFTKKDIWVPASAHLVMGDFTQAVVGTRQGIRYKIFDQGVITDGAGNVVYSLMESDMIALRVTARYGFKVIADETADGTVLASGEDFPFAVVRPEQ
jgi:HK97 family phage major capsid protein